MSIGYCVVCGSNNDGSHKCDPVKLTRIEAGYKAWENREVKFNKPFYGTRLQAGFAAMYACENNEE